MSGILYLCATPIGNLGDITPRVLETLKAVDLIAAEDTRNSIKLLNHFDIHTAMTSYHEYNKVEKAAYLIQKLQEGNNIALITDAGTPAISDPGEILVKNVPRIRNNGYLASWCFCMYHSTYIIWFKHKTLLFRRFSSGRQKERREILEDLKKESRTIILYEAPHHLIKTLEDLYTTLGSRKLTICRELTKRFETVLPTTLQDALVHYQQEEPRGEYVLVIEGKSLAQFQKEQEADWQLISIEDHMQLYEQQGIPRKEAMKQVAKDRGISKRDVYQYLLEKA